MNDTNFEQMLKDKLDELPDEIQPRRDLWPEIDLALEDQIQNAGRNNSTRWMGIAASLAVLGIVGLLSLNISTEPKSEYSEINHLMDSMSEQHESQKQFLLTSYEQQPALTNNWRDQLNELDGAAILIKTALEEDPSDTRLIKLLQQVYQQQIKLIQSVHQPEWL